MSARWPVALALLALTVASCSKDAEATSVAIRTDDTTCSVATTSFARPGDVTFAVTNGGKKVTEVYVYGKGSEGDFDKVVAEAEDIAPGTTRELRADLEGGDYEIACKPGQTGNGIRTAIEVQGKGGTAQAAYDREVEVTATDFALKGLQGFTAKAGEKIEFTLTNKSSSMEHELEVFGPDGKPLGEVGPTKPGEDGEVVLELAKAGTYTYECGIADHAGKGMKGSFVVSP